MKKYIFFFAAAALSLAACSKNEVTPAFSDENAEITFNVAPKTKALSATQSDFSTSNVFVSYAYYLPSGKTWAANQGEAKLYIDDSEISYNTNCWKNATTPYYWPKDGGSLTFFSWSLNRDNVNLVEGSHSASETFHCTTEYGVFGNIDLTPEANKNADLLVANIAADKKANEQTYSFTGVPTLFRHKLSMVACTVKTDKAYANKEFTLNSINFLKIANAGYYAQLPTESFTAETGSAKDDKLVYTEEDQTITTTDTAVAKEDRVIYVPQTFDENTLIEVNYTVTTTVNASNKVVENCTVKKPVKDIFAQWEMGHRYIFHLVFSLDEILWDPAVENWIDVASGDITIK